jgi:hypothetical protein
MFNTEATAEDASNLAKLEDATLEDSQIKKQNSVISTAFGEMKATGVWEKFVRFPTDEAISK